MKTKTQIPFETDSFDKIYLESVLGILEGTGLENLLKEIKRELRNNGILVINETIWLGYTSLDEIHYINEFCKHSFGIIQSTSKYPYLRNWIDMLTNLNFISESVTNLNEVEDDIKSEFRFLYVSLSSTLTGRVK
jgi:SAM-dependent methyltransferase